MQTLIDRFCETGHMALSSSILHSVVNGTNMTTVRIYAGRTTDLVFIDLFMVCVTIRLVAEPVSCHLVGEFS